MPQGFARPPSSIFGNQQEHGQVGQVKRVRPEGDFAHTQAGEVFSFDLPHRCERQEEGKAERNERKAEGAGKIIIRAKGEIFSVPFPERSVKNQEQRAPPMTAN